MSRRLLALAASALVLPLLAGPAVAAPAKGPETPTVAHVAAIYPQFEGGSVDVDHGPVPSLGEDCEDGKPVPGARSTFASYEMPEPEDPMDLMVFPFVFVGSVSFRSVRDASVYVDSFARLATDCLGDAATGTTVKKARFRLGEQRAGFVMTTRIMRQKSVSHLLVARTGTVVAVSSVTSDGRGTPLAKTVRLTALTLRTAR